MVDGQGQLLGVVQTPGDTASDALAVMAEIDQVPTVGPQEPLSALFDAFSKTGEGSLVVVLDDILLVLYLQNFV